MCAKHGISRGKIPVLPQGGSSTQHHPQEVIVSEVTEVGKMTTFYLRPIPLPSTQQVDDLAYLVKKGRVEMSMLTTFNLWKG